MYIAIILVLTAITFYFILTGIKNKNGKKTTTGVIIGVLTYLFFWSIDVWGEILWFEAVGYSKRYWFELSSNYGFGIAGALFSILILYLLTLFLPKDKKFVKIFSISFAAIIGWVWGFNNWDVIWKFWYQVPANIKDPILGKDAGFYLFTLPFLDKIYSLLFSLSLLALIAAAFSSFFVITEKGLVLNIYRSDRKSERKFYYQLFINASIFVLVLGFSKIVSRYHLMYSEWGAVMGPGWTDVNIRFPAYSIIIVLTFLMAILIFASMYAKKRYSPPVILASSGAVLLIFWFIALTLVPAVFQWIRVTPNEISYERPYIENNIKFTRYGFGLNNIEEKEFPVSEKLTQQNIDQNQDLFSNIRLWDWRALDAVYKQFQEIRLYYEFKDVDIDRYKFNNTYRQVMISAREMQSSNLPAQSQTFINERFKYTHGYGITLTTVSDFTAQGLPHLLIKDIPPVSEYPELEVKQPQIYYGELTDSYVVVNTAEKEFDYPSGEDNVYIDYPGKGGVQLSNIWRKFLFGWKFDGTKFFFSSYPTSKSRIMFHRQIEDRVKRVAPFLHFDDDPYIVLSKGKLYWIIDAYTSSSYFPYSEAFNSRERIQYNEGNSTNTLTNIVDPYLDGKNYVRNSVKAVVDAFDGSISFYIFQPDDPIIQVWDKIFPGLFKRKKKCRKIFTSIFVIL